MKKVTKQSVLIILLVAIIGYIVLINTKTPVLADVFGPYLAHINGQEVRLFVNEDHTWIYEVGQIRYVGKWATEPPEDGSIRITFVHFPGNFPTKTNEDVRFGFYAPFFELSGGRVRSCFVLEENNCFVHN